MRRYRLELVCESGEGKLEEAIFRTSADVVRVLRPLFNSVDREKLVVVLLDAKHRPIGVNVVSIGSLTATVVHPRLCFAKHNLGYVAAAVMWRSGRSSSARAAPQWSYAT